jgi:3',5'-cyclic AMP phosphodiesterase CpdA
MHDAGGQARLLAISDLHISYQENRDIVSGLRPTDPGDWLIVAGDVGERSEDIAWAMELLADRFEKVIWVPGNHELWTPRGDLPLRGVERYEHLVETCRKFGVVTPEDPWPVWTGAGGPVRVAPMFLLYDYTFRPEGTHDTKSALAYAHKTGIVCTDEYLLHPEPFADRAAWCRERVALTERRLEECDPSVPLVPVNHYPLVREPTRVLRYPEFALWCGTEATADWHTRFPVAVMVYGHLHIPRTTFHDGVRFEEVSLGYPREWRRRATPPGGLRDVLRVSDDGPGDTVAAWLARKAEAEKAEKGSS